MTQTEVVNPLPVKLPGQIFNGVYTVIGPKGHRTVKVKTVEGGNLSGRRIVYVMTGTDNLFDYTGVAFLNTVDTEVEEDIPDEFDEVLDTETGLVNRIPRKHKVVKPVDSLQIWKTKRGTDLHKVVNAWFRILTVGIEGYRYEVAKHCVRCNRLLTNPESIELGVGPLCAQGGIDQ